MAFLEQPIDINDIPADEKRDFDPIPAGWYTAAIAGADIKETKAGTGNYIAVRFDVTGPEYQGRVVWTNLNTRNPNPKAEEIGRQQLGNIMRAIGLTKLEDTDQLLGGNLSIKVSVRDDPNYGPSNEVKGYRATEGSAPPGAAFAPYVAPPTAKTAENAASEPPWASKSTNRA
jgi:hypothetical protein|tara:strand:- start:261 stop:779 length:519 start_codon:yes stop_codon:yes gene_type:complete